MILGRVFAGTGFVVVSRGEERSESIYSQALKQQLMERNSVALILALTKKLSEG